MFMLMNKREMEKYLISDFGLFRLFDNNKNTNYCFTYMDDCGIRTLKYIHIHWLLSKGTYILKPY